jgi:hydroxyacylglutathione hydrolase
MSGYSMIVKNFTVGPLATNCYCVTCEKTQKAVVIDPGGISKELTDAVNGNIITAILLTHGHFDHIEGVGEISEMTCAPVEIHREDAYMLTDPARNGSYMIGREIHAPEASVFLSEGDLVAFGESKLMVVHTPGHSTGSVSFVAENEFVICGDTLFRLSVGRWDLPGGDYSTLIHTLNSKFMNLADSMVVYPGHGESTTIGFEKVHNEFMK